jgi:hypothetical protein
VGSGADKSWGWLALGDQVTPINQSKNKEAENALYLVPGVT